MALEIERRFLIAADADGWRHRAQAPQPLRQAYLAASADGVTVRVRLQEGGKAWLTLKAAADSSGLVRHEFEYAFRWRMLRRCGVWPPIVWPRPVMPLTLTVAIGWLIALRLRTLPS